MKKEDYSIFEYRLKKEILFADIVYHERVYGNFEKISIKTENEGYIDMSIYHPHDRKDDLLKVVFNFHGGGNVLAFYEQDGKYCQRLADLANCAIINVDYVVAPEFKFPRPIYSSYEAITNVLEKSKELHLDRSHVMVMGHSAGGNISASLLLLDKQKHNINFKGAILDYPPLRQSIQLGDRQVLDPQKAISRDRMMQYIEWYYNDLTELDDPLASPLLGDLIALPPLLIITAEYDSLKQEAYEFSCKAKASGVKVNYKEFLNCQHGFTHDCFKEYRDEESQQAWQLMAEFIKSIMG